MPDEYISREEALEITTRTCGDYAAAFAEIRRLSAVDAVQVTRCRDCVHWDDDPDTYGADYGPKGKCMKSFETMCADDFCSYGEYQTNTGGNDNVSD